MLVLHIFMLLLFIFGIFLAIVYTNIDNVIRKMPNSNTDLQNANKAILVISVMFIVIGFSYLACHRSCNCDLPNTSEPLFYVIFSALLGIILIVLGSLIQAKSGGNDEIVKNAPSLWISGVILALIGFIYIIYSGMKKLKSN
uniref:Uncharacterized protein n=1 Tax=viral metagenome TaxID=1070528 RepID=A0A6C0D0R4_9ZZZZ